MGAGSDLSLPRWDCENPYSSCYAAGWGGMGPGRSHLCSGSRNMRPLTLFFWLEPFCKTLTSQFSKRCQRPGTNGDFFFFFLILPLPGGEDLPCLNPRGAGEGPEPVPSTLLCHPTSPQRDHPQRVHGEAAAGRRQPRAPNPPGFFGAAWKTFPCSCLVACLADRPAFDLPSCLRSSALN